MCGIWCIIHGGKKSYPYSPDECARMQHPRGPESQETWEYLTVTTTSSSSHPIRVPRVTMLFQRLAIMDPSPSGMQPMHYGPYTWMCNGEIYNYKDLWEEIIDGGSDAKPKSASDCEVIGPLLEACDGDFETMLKRLRGVFAIVLLDRDDDAIYAARDWVGVRPLYVASDLGEGSVVFASELKAVALNQYRSIYQFPPGHYTRINITTVTKTSNKYCMVSPTPYCTVDMMQKELHPNVNGDVVYNVRAALERSVALRVHADRPIACLLSGGLDSSLIASLVVREHVRADPAKNRASDIETFSIGMPGSTDLEAAEKVARFLGTKHHTVTLSEEEFLGAIPDVVQTIETYDTTTVRASVGMYLLARYISQNSKAKRIFTGEGADEVCQGYRYFLYQPSAHQGHLESLRLIRDLHCFDVQRADRCISAWGLEATVPFLDYEFVRAYLSVRPTLRCPRDGVEKWLLRKAFNNPGSPYLPREILFRKKEAFSDGVSSVERSWHTVIAERAATVNLEVESGSNHNRPSTPEQSWYRALFNIDYGRYDKVVPYFWRPKWTKETTDPSARELKAYESG